MDSSNASEECSESFKFSAYQLVDQHWHKYNLRALIIFVKKFWVTRPQTPMLCMLIVFHTMSFAVALSKGLIHYYYMPQASKILSTGIASIAIPSYKFTIWALHHKEIDHGACHLRNCHIHSTSVLPVVKVLLAIYIEIDSTYWRLHLLKWKHFTIKDDLGS